GGAWRRGIARGGDRRDEWFNASRAHHKSKDVRDTVRRLMENRNHIGIIWRTDLAPSGSRWQVGGCNGAGEQWPSGIRKTDKAGACSCFGLRRLARHRIV